MYNLGFPHHNKGISSIINSTQISSPFPFFFVITFFDLFLLVHLPATTGITYPINVLSTTQPGSCSRLEMNGQYRVAFVHTEQQSKHLSSRSESISTPEFQPHYHSQTKTLNAPTPPHPNAANAQKIEFLTLPHELRDQIYCHLIVAADPIQYDKNFQTLSDNNTFTTTAMM